MSTTLETLLTELTKEVRVNTESYIRLESTLKTEIEGLREDYKEVKASLNNLIITQANHGERLVINETRISDLQELRRDLSELKTVYSSLKSEVRANAPVRTPWTAIVSAVVALGVLMYTVFGQ